jgi:hypothetical protein
MKNLHLILVLILSGTAVCVAAVPRTDLPETAFNETDAPVNQAPPIFPRLKFVRPVGDPIVLPSLPLNCADSVVCRSVPKVEAAESHRHSHCLQILLCTFLI